MKKIKKIKYKCSDCGKQLSSFGQASQKCQAPQNLALDLGHTVSSQEYFEMEAEGSYDGKGPNEK